jgi:hypothetical protein
MRSEAAMRMFAVVPVTRAMGIATVESGKTVVVVSEVFSMTFSTLPKVRNLIPETGVAVSTLESLLESHSTPALALVPVSLWA